MHLGESNELEPRRRMAIEPSPKRYQTAHVGEGFLRAALSASSGAVKQAIEAACEHEAATLRFEALLDRGKYQGEDGEIRGFVKDHGRELGYVHGVFGPGGFFPFGIAPCNVKKAARALASLADALDLEGVALAERAVDPFVRESVELFEKERRRKWWQAFKKGA